MGAPGPSLTGMRQNIAPGSMGTVSDSAMTVHDVLCFADWGSPCGERLYLAPASCIHGICA